MAEGMCAGSYSCGSRTSIRSAFEEEGDELEEADAWDRFWIWYQVSEWDCGGKGWTHIFEFVNLGALFPFGL